MKRMQFVKLIAAFSTVAVLASPLYAQERGTKEEAVTLMNAALDHVKKVGVTKAMDDFTNDKTAWTVKDMYVSAVDWKGNTLAHGFNPKLVGRNVWDIKDNSDFLFIQEIVKVAQTKGEGWVSYKWADPLTKKLADKSTYVRRVPGTEVCLNVGIYR